MQSMGADEENRKKIMFVMRQAPHGTIYSYEGLEAVLITSAYEQDVSMVFIGDGVFALLKGQETGDIGLKGYIDTYRVLPDYGVEKIYVDRKSMEDRALAPSDFVIDVEVKESNEISVLMQEQHATIPY